MLQALLEMGWSGAAGARGFRFIRLSPAPRSKHGNILVDSPVLCEVSWKPTSFRNAVSFLAFFLLALLSARADEPVYQSGFLLVTAPTTSIPCTWTSSSCPACSFGRQYYSTGGGENPAMHFFSLLIKSVAMGFRRAGRLSMRGQRRGLGSR